MAASQQSSVAVPQRQPMMDAAANAIETPDSSAEAHIVKTADMPPATLDKKIAFNEFSLDLWVSVVSQLGLTGMTASLANTLSLEEVGSAELVYHYTADQEALLSGVHKERIQDAILDYFNASIEVKFVKNTQTRDTQPIFSRKKAERLEEAIVSFEQDLVVQTLVEEFQGVVIRDSIVPIDTNGL